MDAEWVRRYPVIAGAIRQGADLDQVPQLMGIPYAVWQEIQADPAFLALFEDVEPAASAMSSEEVLNRATSMTSEAFETLEEIIHNPRATASTRLQAATTVFNWREELQRKKAEAESRVVYHLHIDGRAVKRMDALIAEFLADEGKAWLREMADIMPNSTA